jgi:type I restriction enzyme S subunit
MNAERLLKHYERIADAPDAIARMRRFVLDLAVRGNLVPQIDGEEPAFESLKRIAGQAARLVKAGKIKKQLATSLQSDDTWPVPASWTFVSLETLAMPSGLFTDGDWVESKDQDPNGDIRLTQLADVGVGEYRNRSSRFMNLETATRLNCTFLKPGDILIARMPDPLGRACIFPGDPKPSVTVVDVAVLRLGSRDFVANYIVQAINSPQFARNVELKAAGTTRSRISRGNLSQLPFPLPPIPEQRRIVAKTDELIALCDRLEAARARRETTRDRLATAGLSRLNAPNPDPHSFAAHARFVLDNLPAFTTRLDQIAQLRKTILNLAIRGRLLAQDPSDEPASEVLKRIAVETPARPADEPRAIPFEAPKNWVWIYLGLLITHSDAGWSPKTEDSPRQGDKWGVLKVSAVSWDKFRASENKQVLPHTEPRLQARVKRGDFLISRANTAELVARAVIVDEEPLNLMMSDKIVRLRLSNNCNPRFILIVNNYASFSRDHYVRHASGVSPSMKNVSRDVIMRLPIPFPPLAEQHRIIAKVDMLMAICDQLQASLAACNDERGRLLNALLAEALSTSERITPVKAKGMGARG